MGKELAEMIEENGIVYYLGGRWMLLSRFKAYQRRHTII